MIKKVQDMTESQRNRIIFNIMQCHPPAKVRDKILQEVLKYKWLDCERMGIDIYQELDDEDQISAAGFHWRMLYWRYYYRDNDTGGVNQPRDLGFSAVN